MGVLDHITIIDCGRFLAGPFAATLLSDFGAKVIKVEVPRGGDELRRLGPLKDGESLWWNVEARNKQSVTLDLHHPEGQDLFRRLVASADVVVESFRPGTLEKWNLGYETLSRENPGLIMLRVTGYGQTGLYIHRPGFNTTAESLGGLRLLVGEPDRPPGRPGVALGDYLGGLFGAIGTLLALYDRDRMGGSASGQVVDTALYESVLRVLEHTVAAYDQLGLIRQRVGAGSAGTVPARAFLSADQEWVGIAAPSDVIFAKLCQAIGRPEMATDPRWITNAARIENRNELDAALEAWMAGHRTADAIRILEAHGVPVQKVYSVKDITEDQHIAAREMIASVPHKRFGRLRMQGVVPKLSRTPGTIRSAGPSLGEDNEEVYGGRLGLSKSELERLKSNGVI